MLNLPTPTIAVLNLDAAFSALKLEFGTTVPWNKEHG